MKSARFLECLRLQCAAVVLLSSYLYAEYMLMLVPPAVLLKYFQHTFEVHSRQGQVESAEEMVGHFSSFEPLGAAQERFQRALRSRGEAFQAQLRSLVDVVLARCGEDLSWLLRWLERVLRDEWTPEVPGVRLRLVVYEKCSIASASGLDGRELLSRLLKLGAIDVNSRVEELTEPQGFENVAYVSLGDVYHLEAEAKALLHDEAKGCGLRRALGLFYVYEIASRPCFCMEIPSITPTSGCSMTSSGALKHRAP